MYRFPGALFSFVLLVMLACPVPAGAASDADAPKTVLEPMAVTGSRLSPAASRGMQPLTVIDRRTLLDSGHRTLGAFLRELPFMAGAPLGGGTPRRGEGGGLSRGIETAELRGLGAERTLVLINGRRPVPGGAGASGLADIAMIPVALVERVEILRAGASVDYGADAVAGVVNIITREIDGATLHAAGGVTDRGDGEHLDAGLALGHGGDGWHWSAALNHSDQAPVGRGERAFSRHLLTVDGPDNRIVPGGSSAPPEGNFVTSMGRLTRISGRDGTDPDDFRPYVSGGADNDRFNFNPYEDLIQNARRDSALVTARYRFRPELKVWAEAGWQRRSSATRLAPLPLFSIRLDDVAVSADNHYNPFGEELTDVRRRLVEAGARTFKQDTRTWWLAAGIEGAVGHWLWDASWFRGRHRIDQRQRGDLLADRVARALGPSFVDDAGRPACGHPGAPVPGCVPLNLFGPPGSIDRAMLDYVGADLRDRGFNELTGATINLLGDLWRLPAGSATGAVGYAYRDETGADLPDLQTAAGNTTGAAREATRGGFHSHEVYAELGLPLTRDLDLEAGVRAMDFSGFSTRTVFQTGVAWRPAEGLLLRGGWSQTLRAPNIRERFGGATRSSPVLVDPCADFTTLESAEIRRCIDQGVPADGSFDQSGNETPEIGGGNPDLQPESGRMWTLGAVWRPPSVPGLRASLDFYDIRILEAIGALGAGEVLARCLVIGGADLCGRIERAAGGEIVQVRTRLENIARETARGVDGEVAYGHAVPGGTVIHRILTGWLWRRDRTPFPGAATSRNVGFLDPGGTGAAPRWRSSYRVDWRTGRWMLGYAATWTSGLRERGGALFPGTTRRGGSILYQDLHAGYELSRSLRLIAGVDNLFDRQPPLLVNADPANTDVSSYRLLGRSWWLRLDYRP